MGLSRSSKSSKVSSWLLSRLGVLGGTAMFTCFSSGGGGSRSEVAAAIGVTVGAELDMADKSDENGMDREVKATLGRVPRRASFSRTESVFLLLNGMGDAERSEEDADGGTDAGVRST